MDTLAVQLCTSSLPTRTRDLHPLERAHGARTKKSPETLNFRAFLSVFVSRLSLAEFPYLFGDRQALLKTLANTEMVLRFPLGFA